MTPFIATTEQVEAAQRVLLDAGYNLGTTGIDGDWGRTTQRAVERYLANEEDSQGINQTRREFYESFEAGTGDERYFDITRDVDGAERTIRFSIRDDAVNDAQSNGFTLDDALKSTNYETYQALIDSSFETENLTEVEISGGFRVSFGSAVHKEGRGLDISSLTFNEDGNTLTQFFNDPVRGQPYYRSGAVQYNTNTGALNGLDGTPSTLANGQNRELDIAQGFSDNLIENENVGQVIGPFRSSFSGGDLGASNIIDIPNTTFATDALKVNQMNINNKLIGHRNHLHFTINQGAL